MWKRHGSTLSSLRNAIAMLTVVCQFIVAFGLPLPFVRRTSNESTPYPAACDAGTGVWNAKRGEQWINGHYGNTLYNHYYTPNPVGKWDCGNASHNKANGCNPSGIKPIRSIPRDASAMAFTF